MTYRVVFTGTADEHIRIIADWWTVHRPKAPDLFLNELEAALDLLRELPAARGKLYPNPEVQGLRRLILRRSGYHVYYTVDPGKQRVLVRNVWHTARGAGPHGAPR